jgi:hypothetical protein
MRMSVHSSLLSAVIDERRGASAQRSARVLALFEPTPAGVAALQEAVASSDPETHLTVVTLAPQSLAPRCCARGPSVEVVNCVVREEAASELREAREILGDQATRVTFRTLVGRHDPPVDAWAAEQDFDLIVLPARRLAFGGHPLARKFRRATTAEIRLVGSPRRHPA